MPKDFLFPPLTGASRKITLTANTAFAPAMLGAMVDLNGFQLNLTGATGYGFFILTGSGTLIGAATATLGPTQAMMIAVEDAVFHFIDQPNIDLSALNAQIALKAPLASPAFTGTPTAPTASQGTSNTQLATTGFVTVGLAGKSSNGHTHTFSGVDGLDAAINGINAALAIKANVASPALTGTPTAPTAAPGTNTTQLATTAFVVAAISGLSGGAGAEWGYITGSIAAQGDLNAALADAKSRTSHTGTQAISTVTDLQNQLNLRSPLASPTFTGVPAGPTAAPGTNTTQLATTGFVATLVASEVGTLNSALALKSPLASPNFTGIPLVDTAAPGTNTRQAASTEFVQAAVAGVSNGSGLPVITRTALEGSPTGVGESPATLANNTIRFITSSNVSVTGGTQSINRDYLYVGGKEWRAASNPSEHRIYFLDGYWYITHRNTLGYVFGTGDPLVFRAAGTINDDPSVLTYAHAPASGGSGGAWVITAISGSFAGTPGIVTPAGLGQKWRVGPYALTGGRTEAYDWFIAETIGVSATWRQIDEAQPLTSTAILAALASLDAGQITALRSILSSASVNLNPLP